MLQATGWCLVCRLSNKEWTHPKGIIITGNQGGQCSTKIADTPVPQVAPNIVNTMETFGVKTENIKILLHDPQARLPTKATTGSATYNLFPLEEHTIPAHTRLLISTGLKIEIPTPYYGQISSRSGLSSKHLIDVTAGVIDSDYRGIIKVLLHNHSDQPYLLSPKQSMAQILFLPLAQPPVVETSEISNTKRGHQGFGSTDPTTFTTEVIELQPVAGRPPGTTFLGAQPSKATVRLNSQNGPLAQVVINSGSNISLISMRLLDKMDPPLKPKTGQEIKISQVTGQSSTSQYVPLELYFETTESLVSIRIEAYIVKDMNAPIILGNDFVDQYSLSII